jgi:hypothetical protein
MRNILISKSLTSYLFNTKKMHISIQWLYRVAKETKG